MSSPRTWPRTSPGELAARLGDLRAHIGSIETRFFHVPVEEYGDAGRPCTLLQLAAPDGRVRGAGEFIGFTERAHESFAAVVRSHRALAPGSRGPVAALLAAAFTDPLDHPTRAAFTDSLDGATRAAFEGALLDLALRQNRLSLSSLARPHGPPSAALRYVVSFDAGPDPARRVRAIRAANPSARFKIDVSPEWSQSAVSSLSAPDLDDAVEILDFKHRGSGELAAMLRHHFPRALFEDPPVAALRGPGVCRDSSIHRAEDAAAALADGEHVNLKAPRMGGFLEVLRALELCRDEPSTARLYFGGMSEVDVGRRQARQLAALFTPRGPNDLGPMTARETAPRAPSPLRINLASEGFGPEEAPE